MYLSKIFSFFKTIHQEMRSAVHWDCKEMTIQSYHCWICHLWNCQSTFMEWLKERFYISFVLNSMIFHLNLYFLCWEVWRFFPLKLHRYSTYINMVIGNLSSRIGVKKFHINILHYNTEVSFMRKAILFKLKSKNKSSNISVWYLQNAAKNCWSL